MSHDNTAAIYGTFKKLGITKVKYPERLAITLITPCPRRRRSTRKTMLRFAALFRSRA